jgi:hypothetical protein
MSKGIMSIGYQSYVLDTQDAVTLFEILSKAERYEDKYRGSENKNTIHVWEADTDERNKFSFSLIPNSLYRVAKLAGKPEEKS